MKIAAITDDGTNISQHFGRAPFYAVYTVEDKQIVKREMRDKMGHQQFVHQEAHLDETGRHGFGPGSQQRHAAMAVAIEDCDVLLSGGMGWGAFESIKQAGIRTVVTDTVNIEDAVQAYLDGTIVERTDLLH
ncbi:MAG: NifB/NifX family molybdenum-iron cluster-binding protein [Anaerolineae bacterium]